MLGKFCIFVCVLGAQGLTVNKQNSDPCALNPCGLKAECEVRANMAVCICPPSSSGDPFTECKDFGGTPNAGTTTKLPIITAATRRPSPVVRKTTMKTTNPTRAPTPENFATSVLVESEYRRKPIRESEAVSVTQDDSPMTPIFVASHPKLTHSEFPMYDQHRSTTPHYNVRPETPQKFPSSGYQRIEDPLGKYDNCRMVNNIVVCAEGSSDYKFDSGLQKLDTANIHYDQIDTPLQSSHSPFRPQESHTQKPDLNFDTDSLCQKFCGKNSICKMIKGRPVCGCPEGHTGDPSVHCIPIAQDKTSHLQTPGSPECTKHVDCEQSHICFQNQCINPCQNLSDTKMASQYQVNSSMCGTHAKCIVIQHTPLCACEEGFYGNPYVGCSG